MFITALFIIAKTWKQPKCLSVGAWEKKWQPIVTMEYYSVPKRNELRKDIEETQMHIMK